MSESIWLKQLLRGCLHQASSDRRRLQEAWIRLGLTRLEDRRVLDAGAMATDLNLGAAFVSSAAITEVSGGRISSVAGQISDDSRLSPALSGPDTAPAGVASSQSASMSAAWWHHHHCHHHAAASIVTITDSTLMFKDVSGRDNSLVVFSDDTNLHIVDGNGHRIASDIHGAWQCVPNEIVIPLTSLHQVQAFVIDTNKGSDSLSLNLAPNTSSVLSRFHSVYFDAGHDDSHTCGDVLQLIGDGGIDASVTPSGARTGDGFALLTSAGESTNVYFTHVEAVDVSGMEIASLVAPKTATNSDELVISDGWSVLTSTEAALVVQGKVGGLPIESIYFHDNEQVVIDTGAGNGGCDHVLVTGASGDHGNQDLLIRTGNADNAGNQVVAIIGDVNLHGDLKIDADQILIADDVTVFGTVELMGRDAVTFSEHGAVLAIGAGGVVIDGDADDQGGGQITMAAGSWINAGCGTIALQADGDVLLGRLVTANSMDGAIRVESTHDILLGAAITSHGSVEILADNSILASQQGRIESAGDVRLIADRDSNGAGTIRFAADIVVGPGFATFHLAGSDGLFSGSLSGPGGLVKQGSGTLELTGTSLNTYRGTTVIESGTLVVDGVIGSCVPAGRLTIGPESTLSGGGIINAPIYADAITARIISTGNLRLGDGSIDGFDFAGALVVGAGQHVMLRDADVAHLGLTTTVEQDGVLDATMDVEVSAGELLVGDGTVDGGVIVLAGGEITPGVGVGALGTGRLVMHAGSTLTVEIFGAAAGSEYDQLNARGEVSLDGALLNLTGPALDFATGTEFVLINNSSGMPVQGYLVDTGGQVLVEGAKISGNGFKAIVSYVGGQDGNDVTLTVVNRIPFFATPSSESDGSQRALAGIYALGADLERTRIHHAGEAFLFEIEAVQTPQSNTLFERRQSDLEDVARAQLRVFFRIYDDAVQKEIGRDYELQPTDLNDPLGVFHRYHFPNGHYRIYVQETGSKHERLVLDVHVYDGKVVPAGYRDAGASESPESSGKVPPVPAKSPALDSIPPQSNGTGKPAKEPAQTKDPSAPLNPSHTQSRSDTMSESSDASVVSDTRQLALLGIGLAELATVHQWRVRVREAMATTSRDTSRVARLMQRIRRRQNSDKGRSS